MPTTRSIQIRLGQKSSEKLKKWADNQSNLNDSVKRVLDHFIDVYGQHDIDSLEVKLKMAKDLVAAQGQPFPLIKVPDGLEVVDIPIPKSEEKKKIVNRGTIDI